MMKRFFAGFLSLMLLGGALCSALEVRLEPVRRNVTLGKFIQLQLSSDKQITRVETPAVQGARWENSYSSTGMSSINGKVTYTRTLMLVPEGEGSVTIPPVKVHAGKESAMTREVKVNVLPRSSSSQEARIADVLKGKVTIAGAAESYYTGEELLLYCDLLIDERFLAQIRPSYFPELLNTSNAVFTTYNYRNSQVRFRIAPQEEVVENKRAFIRHRFIAQCRLLIPGKFAPGAMMRVGVVQKSSADEDDFFGGFGFGSSFFNTSRVEPYTVRFTPAAAVEIKPLPPLPADSKSCGLVGKWQISSSLSSKSLRQGEVVELVLKFRGEGSPENFRAPQLDLPGFRIYPPEVTKKPREITAKYALIPLEPGEKLLKDKLAYFSPSEGKWLDFPLEFKVAVVPGKGGKTGGVQKNFVPPAPAAAATAAKAEEKNAAERQLLYQKNAPGALTALPLIRNDLLLLLFFVFGMPLAAAAIELYFRRREKECSSPELQEQRRRRKAMAALHHELRTRGDTPEFRERLIPLLGESMGLSAGASAGDIAGEIRDPELCRYFAGIETSSYMPGESSNTVLSPQGKKSLLALLKKYTLWALLLVCATGVSASELNREFNNGEFAKASARYLKLAGDGNGYRAAMLYNYGNSQYYLNNLPEARWALNLAKLLSPGDGEIRANLDHVNGQLFNSSPGTGTFGGALRELRDHFRCDQYLLFGSFCWGMIWILWSFRRKLGSSLFYGCAGTLLLFGVFCIVSCGAQLRENYSPRRIIITAKSAELRTLPGRNAGNTESTLPGGSEGELIQRDGSGFCRVRINGREGWLTEKSFKRVFPGKLF